MPDQLFATFGLKYAREPHPLKIHPDGVVVVEGKNAAEATDNLFRATDGQHAFQYPIKDLERSLNRYYPRGVIGRIDADGYHPIEEFTPEEES